ncbi:RDD family protein [Aquabacterium sp.]|uniref:RDD family protein n=1 Tax=Aquabacterium sp. TaxID=1872578 RepID=UPI0019979DCB|nr:RDD family protein [Aquabacterium sp.]MBC7701179.1 RDD family protein [Aquabacterium sp.]
MSLDTLYTAETPEGIALSLRPAGVMARSLAYLVDAGIRLVIFFFAALIARPMGGVGSAFLMILYFALEWFYPVVFELTKSGATPGKRMMDLHVVMDSGLPITPAASITRNLLRAADFLPMGYAAGMLSMLTRRDFKRLGDLAAGTLVVYHQTVQLHGVPPPAPAVPPTRQLSLKEQAAIVSWTGRSARLTPARLDELAVIAASVTRPDPGVNVRGEHDATRRLQGVAQWLLGHRQGGGSP